jgi:tetratricopeptide (TPR) repeat protein
MPGDEAGAPVESAPETGRSSPAAGRCLGERDVLLSHSLLWRLQRRFFERAGARAWTDGPVPHYITTNPWIAASYAKVVFGWLRDLAGAASGDRRPPLDLGRPVHIVELGCGSGRFAYRFLLRFFEMLSRSPLAEISVRYVLTDFTERNLEPLLGHPSLRPFVAAGLLDFARFDVGRDVDLRLLHSGEVLTAETGGNPLAVVANYVFDGLPQDCFAVRGGRLFEGRLSASSSHLEPDAADPAMLSRLELSWEFRPAAAPYYGDAEWDLLLEEYRQRLQDTVLLFPVAALEGVRHLARLARGRLLLLAGDKGYVTEESLAGRAAPVLDLHGSSSLMVNFHALGRWVAGQGGEFLAGRFPHPDFSVIACLLGAPAGGWAETRFAFEEAVDRAGPADFVAVKQGLEAHYPDLSLEQLLAWLRLSGWDSGVFLGCFPVLLKRAAAAPAELQAELAEAARQVWEVAFPLPERCDLAFHLGVLLTELGRWADARRSFEHSIALHGPNPATAFNLALCRFRLGELEAARGAVEEILAAEPDLEAAVELQQAVAAALSGGGLPDAAAAAPGAAPGRSGRAPAG